MPQPTQENPARIVEALWKEPGLSRIELAALLELDKSTLSRSTGRLLDHGVLLETEEKDPSPKGGRKRVGLKICGNWGLWLGLELQPDLCRGVLVDFAGKVRDDFSLSWSLEDDGMASILAQAGHEAAERSEKLGIPLIASGLGVPGAIRPETGIVERSRPLGIDHPFDLHYAATQALGLETSVDNDVNCSCRAEIHFAVRPATPHFLFLLAESRSRGIALGLGTVIGGILHRGDHGASGELLSVYRGNGVDQLAVDQETLSRASDDPAVLIEVAGELAPQMALLANAFDLDRLILGGMFRNAFDDVAPIFLESLSTRRTYPDLAEPQVLPASRGDEGVAYGAAVHFTENLSNQAFWRNI